MEEIKVRDEFIKLGQLLKLADMVQDGQGFRSPPQYGKSSQLIYMKI